MIESPVNEDLELIWALSVMPWEAPESQILNKSSAGTLPGVPEECVFLGFVLDAGCVQVDLPVTGLE